MTEIDLDAIQARADAATTGPWIRTESFHAESGVAVGQFPRTRVIVERVWTSPADYGRADAEFIAHARTDVPVLHAEVHRLREQLQPYVAEEKREKEWDAFCELSDLRCIDCGIRFGERQEYRCEHPGKHTDEFPRYGAGHCYEKSDVQRLATAAGRDEADL